MIVFASNKNRRTPGRPLHTNFKLSADGEYLALVMPDGVTMATEFAPTFPPQFPDVSYGFGLEITANLLLTTNATGSVLVPTDATLGTNWTAMGFNDAAWRAATNGIGFETGQSEDPGNVPPDVLADNPAGYWRLGETNGTVAVNSGWIAGTGDGQYLGGVVNGVAGPCPPVFNGFESGNLAARFNGSGARVEIPYTPDLNPSAAFTVEAWVRPASTNSSTGVPVSSMYVSGSRRLGYSLYQNNSDAPNQWEFRLGNNSGIIASAHGGTPDTNQWQYLAGVYDGSTAQLYVNGSLAASATLNWAFAPNNSAKLIIGGRSDGYYFAGDVDEVSVIARALSAAEITTRYQMATNGVAATNVFNYTGLIKTDLRTDMSGLNSSAYLRLPFNLTNVTAINSLKLRARYDDGFAAFLNGALVASDNAPAVLDWNSSATNRRPTADALQFSSFDLAAAIGYLQDGANVLALQGLNVSATNVDFLLQVELEADSYQYSTDARYFTQPTPGAPNVPGVKDLGPILSPDGFSPALPGTNDSITVTCHVAQAFAPVTNVTLNWRVMYDALQHTPMYDDGLHGDGAAGDGVYGAVITNHVGVNWTYTAGEMVRWYITAQDSLTYTSRWPLFSSTNSSAEYDGTVVQPGYVTSKLPIFHLFINPANQSAADSQTGTRASFYYDGEFYDNIDINLRGNTTAQYAKKSHRLNFNDEHKLRHPGPGGRIAHTTLLAEYMDPSYLRQYLSFWLLNLAGVPCSFDYPVRLQLNGQFYQLAFNNNALSKEELGYLGYDQAGALYKNAGTVETSHFSTAGFEKLLPESNGIVVVSTTDFDAMASAISESLNTGQRETNAFDILNVPEIVDYIATARLNQEGGDTWANMCLYRDTLGSGEWSIVPYDLNLSWGQLYYGNQPSVYYQITATNDFYKSHPFFGGSQIQEAGGSAWNRMYDIIIAVPDTRQMLLRRMRTLMDAFFQPPGTPASQDLIRQQITTITNLIWDDAQLDRQQWGWPPLSDPYGWGSNLWLTNGVNDLIAQYLNPRRQHFFGTHCVTNTAKPIGLTWINNAGIPTAQPTNAVILIGSWDYNPVSGNQNEQYVELRNTNSYAVDVSNWRLIGGIEFTLRPGTVIPAGKSLYLAANVNAFRARATGPHGGQGLFVQGAYGGLLSTQGNTPLILENDKGALVSKNSYAGNSSSSPFVAGNLAVFRAGDGIESLSSHGNSVFIDQFTPGGTLVSSIAIPDNAANALLISGSASSEGALTRSADGRLLEFAGYNIALTNSTSSLSGSSSTNVPRALGIVDVNGAFALVGVTTNQYSGNNIRSGTTDGRGNYWGAGANSPNNGTFYFGSGPAGTIQSTVSNSIVIQDLGGNLYFSTQKITNGIWKISGTPTVPASVSVFLKTGGSSASYAFAFNSDFTTAYVADDTLTGKGGVQRWDYSGGAWTMSYAFAGITNIGARGVAVDFSGAHPVVYATTAEASTNRLVSITDTGAASTVTTNATAGMNQVFRGVALTPDNGGVPQFFKSAGNGNNFTLSWTALVNRNYTLQYIGDLGGTNWITLTNLTAAQPVLTVTDPGPIVSTNRFYRLILNL